MPFKIELKKKKRKKKTTFSLTPLRLVSFVDGQTKSCCHGDAIQVGCSQCSASWQRGTTGWGCQDHGNNDNSQKSAEQGRCHSHLQQHFDAQDSHDPRHLHSGERKMPLACEGMSYPSTSAGGNGETHHLFLPVTGAGELHHLCCQRSGHTNLESAKTKVAGQK